MRALNKSDTPRPGSSTPSSPAGHSASPDGSDIHPDILCSSRDSSVAVLEAVQPWFRPSLRGDSLDLGPVMRPEFYPPDNLKMWDEKAKFARKIALTRPREIEKLLQTSTDKLMFRDKIADQKVAPEAYSGYFSLLPGHDHHPLPLMKKRVKSRKKDQF